MRSSVADVDIFTERIAAWVGAALDEQRPPTFGALLRALPGADPGLVVDCLEVITSQAGASLSTRARAQSLLVQARTPAPRRRPTSHPIPHPLDCYWPNDALTLRALTRTLGQLTPANETIIYLAWPNAFGHARSRLTDRKHLLVEHDRTRAGVYCSPGARHEVLAIDVLRDELPIERAQTIIADPPWYPDELMAFLWAAARLAKPGARILLAFPPIGTRPGVESERRRVLDWAARCGLRPRDFRPGVLGYLTPPFERAALAARGLPGTPDGWRRGDLLIFEAVPTLLPSRPKVAREIWHNAHLDDVPMRVRIDDGTASVDVFCIHNLLESIIDGDVLPTVSRQAALRSRTRLWTSRNRVFSSSHPRLLAAVLDATAGGQSVERVATDQLDRRLDSHELEAVKTVSLRLRALAEQELREHGLR